jgi:hypothetical protein
MLEGGLVGYIFGCFVGFKDGKVQGWNVGRREGK